MNFPVPLYPLYLAGALAIAAPIIFHLIRRTPSGRQEFSSLMFLSSSPPRLTRRSRLNNIFLLLLRAAALALLAFAFARPFFRQDVEIQAPQAQGRRIAMLVDTSASMMRSDLWSQAAARVEDVLKEVTAADEVALFFFDRQARPAMTLREWNEVEPSKRVALLRARLAEAKPTWHETRMGEALASVADQLAEAEGSQREIDRVVRQVVLISDMQQGGHVEALQGHQWPQNVLLEVKSVAPRTSSNAAVGMVKDTAGVVEAADPGGPRLRVRVSNQPQSQRDQFTLLWANERGPVPNIDPVSVYAAAGRAQVARVAWPAETARADRLILGGDDADFDNALYLVPPRVDSVKVIYLGNDAPEDAKGLLYYLKTVASDTARRKVEMVLRRAEEVLTDADLLGARLAVVGGTQSDGRISQLRNFVEAGGDVLWPLTDATAADALRRLTGDSGIEVQEGVARDHVLLARIELDHPLFAPFADTRFSDFTKIHFWKHRRVTLPQNAQTRVIASFDNGAPFFMEHSIGKGRLWIAASGWHPADSQLALSTKFVPLIDGMLKRRDSALVESQYSVGQAIALPQAGADSSSRNVICPDGKKFDLPSGATTFEGADHPGIYRVNLGGAEVAVAVNVPADESRTAPIPVEDLERLGARLGTRKAPEQTVERQRHLQVMELENRQKLWRWLIVAVLGFVVAETALAGYLARRGVQQQQVIA